jgi:hypothetical protein
MSGQPDPVVRAYRRAASVKHYHANRERIRAYQREYQRQCRAAANERALRALHPLIAEIIRYEDESRAA